MRPPPLLLLAPMQEKLDEYDIFRCINYIRTQVQAGSDPLPGLADRSSQPAWRGNDDFLKPVLQDDSLLFHDYEDIVNSWQQ